MNQRAGMKPHELGILTTLDVLLYLASLFTFWQDHCEQALEGWA